jgi:hypothetical protein
LSDDQVQVTGRLTGYVLVAVRSRSLVLTPSFTRIEASTVDYKGNKAPEILVPALNAAARTFIDNINGQLKPLSISIDLNRTFTWDLTTALRNMPGVVRVDAPTPTIHLALSAASILIDDNGVHAIASIAVLGAEIPTETLEQQCSGASPELPQISCPSNTLAEIATKPACEIQKSFRLAAASHEIEQLNATCAAIAARTMAQTSAAGPRTNGSFDDIFKAFSAEFAKAASDVIGDLGKGVETKTHIAVAKSLIAIILNGPLGTPGVHIVIKMAPPPQTFDQDIRLAKAPSLNCNQNQRDCTIHQDCGLRSCSGWDCTYNCKWYQADCHARKLGCEANKALAIKSCQASASAEKLACETDKKAKICDCERLKAMEFEGCKINQEWLNTWSEAKLGSIDGKVDVSGDLDGVLRSIKVADDLSTVELNLGLGGVAHVTADLHLVPANLGHLACAAQWSGAVTAEGIFSDNNLSVSGTVRFEEASTDKPARIGLSSPEREVEIRVAPPPFQALVTQNPNLFITCGPAVALGTAVTELKGLLGDNVPPEITGYYKRSIGPFEIEIDTRPLELKVPDVAQGKALSLRPVWFPKALGFTVGS